MGRIRFALVAFVWCLVALGFSSNVRATGSVLFVNEVPVLQFKATGGSTSPEDHARAISERLQLADLSGSFELKRAGAEYWILLNGDPVVTITRLEAIAHGSTLADLAHTWFAQLQHAAQLPALKILSDDYRAPVGAEKTIGIVGSMAPYVDLSVDRPESLSVKRTPTGMVLKALAPGTATVTVTAGGNVQSLVVQVRPWAAVLPQTLTAFVSGAPATVETVRGAIAGVIRTQLVTAPGATTTFRVPYVTSLGTGVTREFAVRLRATAPDTFQGAGSVNVVVRNIGLPQETDADLWYSNNPESVTRPGPLFSASLKQGKPVRMLYHHLNASTQSMYFRLQAINDSDQEARIMVIPGDSTPMRDPVLAGLRAADQFVRNWMWGSGEIVSIPAHCTLPLSLRRLLPGDTTSGLCGLRLVSGPSDIQIRTDAWPPFPLDPKWEGAIRSSTPWREVGTHPINEFDRAPSEPSDHIYPDPYRALTVDYQVGGRYGFLRIGQSPIAREDNEQKLDGNFGVIYHIKADLSNPTHQPADVELVFEASAGYSAALFIVDGDYVVRSPLQPKAESRIGRYHLTPGGELALDITTLPLSGGSYPATITIRPVQADQDAATYTNAAYNLKDGTDLQDDSRPVSGSHGGTGAGRGKPTQIARRNGRRMR
jgi:hypothetical protein